MPEKRTALNEASATGHSVETEGRSERHQLRAGALQDEASLAGGRLPTHHRQSHNVEEDQKCQGRMCSVILTKARGAVQSRHVFPSRRKRLRVIRLEYQSFSTCFVLLFRRNGYPAVVRTHVRLSRPERVTRAAHQLSRPVVPTRPPVRSELAVPGKQTSAPPPYPTHDAFQSDP
jgi:hypothetical protein